MKDSIILFIKGMMMGAADVVPGVSGGTIAFIAGIYERLINAIKAVLPGCIELLKHRDFGAFWKAVDGTFLLTLLTGVLSSVLLLASVISFLMAAYPIPLWSFFLGLILASVHLVAKGVGRWTPGLFLVAGAGVMVGWGVTLMTPSQIDATPLNLFLGGMIAICAMILPGISGSFILLMLGLYAHVLDAVKSFDLGVLAIFFAGCVAGLLSIANVLSWAFRHFHNATLAILTGIMIGALNKVWPWKEVLSWRENSQGERTPLVDQNVLPTTYTEIIGADAQLLEAVLAMGVGLVIVVLIERMNKAQNS